MRYLNYFLVLTLLTNKTELPPNKRIVGRIEMELRYRMIAVYPNSHATQQIENKSEWCVEGSVSDLLDFYWQEQERHHKEIDSLKNVIYYLQDKDPKKFSVYPSTTIKL